MQAVQIELFPKSREEQEQEIFLNILHHDACKRGGFFARLDLREVNGEKQTKTKWASRKSLSLMTTDSTYNRYITLNSFHNIEEDYVLATGETVKKRIVRRDTEHLHAISTVYLDLDFHDGTMQEIKERVRNTKELLNTVFKNGTLPRPTMVTETGRGLGIFYVLDKTIANTKNAKKQANFWKYICTEFANKYNEILSNSEKPQLEVDYKVIGEVARVVRIPGTTNLKTNTVCRLISVAKNNEGTPLYYTLNSLIQYVENYKVYDTPYKEVKKQVANKKIINFNAYTKPYLVARLDKLAKVQELVIDQREGCRELLCFFYYNTAKQIMDEKEAVESLMAFNDNFTHPITDNKELENIISSVAKAKDKDGNTRGYYEFSDARILEKLGLTEAQNEIVGFGSSLKELERKQKKEENQRKRKERNERIIKYVIEHPEETYEEIAGLFGVSLRTLKNILKQENVHRYQIQVQETSICDAEMPEEDTKEDNIINIEEHVKTTSKKGAESSNLAKVQKNAPVSNCVVPPLIINNTKGVITIPMSENNKEIRITDGTCISVGNRILRGIPVLEDEDEWYLYNGDWVFD